MLGRCVLRVKVEAEAGRVGRGGGVTWACGPSGGGIFGSLDLVGFM